ncbi:Conserved_hypothetical protein [Hexamita inflata]|uniref:EGF-like domain-containing protein n=1 Tax=Hexamita inflata TaxID=28002 RepID=A0AA86RCE0_9EUKA|nr:Conserved hypothetical protein [Hexamita inflata]
MLPFLVQPLLTQLLHQQTSYCTNMLFRTTPIGFCLKQNFITNKQSSQVITNLKNDSDTFFFSIYTEKTQKVTFNLQFDLQQKPSFALIGEIYEIIISDSAMNVSVQNELAYGALICIYCSVDIAKSTLAFVGCAQYISGILLIINEQLLITNSLLQFRLKGQYLGGLICITRQTSELIIKLISSNIIGYDIESYQSGNLISNMTLNEFLPIYFSSVYICTNIKDDIGKGNENVIYLELPVKYCNICKTQYYVYGLCLDSLEFSTLVDSKLICNENFTFNGQFCVCSDGFELNGTVCVNLVELNSWFKNQIQLMKDEINQLKQLNLDLQTQQDDLSSSQYTKVEVDTFLLQLSCPTGAFVISGVCQCPSFASLNGDVCVCPTNSRFVNGQCICPPGSTINTVGCSCNIPSYVVINNQCQCPTGATLANGQCICPMGAIIVDGVCTCAQGAVVIGGTCICSITGAVVTNNVCTCPSGSTIKNGACACFPGGVLSGDGLSCSCPTGTNMQNGVCACDTPKAIFNGVLCACPIYANNVSNVCTCSADKPSTISGVCCPIDSTVSNGLCSCPSSAPTIVTNKCCPTNSKLISGVCTCPSGSSLVNGVCTCPSNASQILVQSSIDICCPTNSIIMNNVCSCPQDKSVLINGLCCPINSIVQSGSCLCPTSSPTVIFGTCCPTGSSVFNGICLCPSSSPMVISGVCCPDDSFLIETTCTCPSGSELNIVLNKCMCKLKGQYIDNGVCKCPSGATFNSVLQQCVCASGSAVGSVCCVNLLKNSKGENMSILEPFVQ